MPAPSLFIPITISETTGFGTIGVLKGRRLSGISAVPRMCMSGSTWRTRRKWRPIRRSCFETATTHRGFDGAFWGRGGLPGRPSFFASGVAGKRSGFVLFETLHEQTGPVTRAGHVQNGKSMERTDHRGTSMTGAWSDFLRRLFFLFAEKRFQRKFLFRFFLSL